MKRKILYTAISDIHLNTFHVPYLEWFKSKGFEVHIAIGKRNALDFSFCDFIHHISFNRSPFSSQNFKAYKDLKKIIDENNFDIVHCHTPVVSVLTRLAAIEARKKHTKVLYTAHGYHFYKGSPFYLWALYYPLEKILSKITDGIITINKEDYEITKKNFFSKKTFYIKGIGIDTKRFKDVSLEEKKTIKKELFISEKDFTLLYVAEFIPRKNHKFLIECLPELKRLMPNLVLLLAGNGSLFESSKELAKKLKVYDDIRFLGWRNDIPNLALLSDIGISTSKQEGLGLGLAEEMLCGIPIVASNDRGHKEMIVHGENGYLFHHNDKQGFIKYIFELQQNEDLRISFGQAAKIKAKEFLIDNSLDSMVKIYNYYLNLVND